MTKTKFEAMDIRNKVDIPVGPILSMKEIAEDESLRATGTVVEVDHPTRGKYLTVGNPIKLSDSPAEVERSPLLGEHTEEILTKVLGYNAARDRRDQGLGRDHGAGKSKARRRNAVVSRGEKNSVAVVPAKAGTQKSLSARCLLDARIRGHDSEVFGRFDYAYRRSRPAGIRQGGA